MEEEAGETGSDSWRAKGFLFEVTMFTSAVVMNAHICKCWAPVKRVL